jgi:hypothetical protein
MILMPSGWCWCQVKYHPMVELKIWMPNGFEIVTMSLSFIRLRFPIVGLWIRCSYPVDDFDAKWMMWLSSQVSSDGRIEDFGAQWIWNSPHVSFIRLRFPVVAFGSKSSLDSVAMIDTCLLLQLTAGMASRARRVLVPVRHRMDGKNRRSEGDCNIQRFGFARAWSEIVLCCLLGLGLGLDYWFCCLSVCRRRRQALVQQNKAREGTRGGLDAGRGGGEERRRWASSGK